MTAVSDQEKSIASVLRAIEAIKAGKMVIMTDDEDRENEGDLILAASAVTPEKINFMAKEARGLICLALTPTQVGRLNLPMMEDSTRQPLPHGRSTAFTVSIEAREGVTTGISATDRAHTIAVASNPASTQQDIVVPGHIFPLRARPGGVLERPGHTEGSVDLARLAGLEPAGVICEIMNDDGTMARAEDLVRFAEKHELVMVTIADLVAYRLMHESHVQRTRALKIKTSYGEFDATLYRSLVDGGEHLALTKGVDQFPDTIVDVRVHLQRPLIDSLGCGTSGGRLRLEHGLRMLAESPAAVFIYMGRELDSWDTELVELGVDAEHGAAAMDAGVRLPAGKMDMRNIGTGAQILRDLGVCRMRVHTTSSTPVKGLAGFGLEVVDNMLITEDCSNI